MDLTVLRSRRRHLGAGGRHLFRRGAKLKRWNDPCGRLLIGAAQEQRADIVDNHQTVIERISACVIAIHNRRPTDTTRDHQHDLVARLELEAHILKKRVDRLLRRLVECCGITTTL
jgi:hypothetical protein